MHGLLMKMGVPVAEANEYIELVEECRMGQLFENFEKVDIKVERKNTEEARKRAEAAEKKAEEERQKAMQSYVSLCRELGGSKETAVRKLIETFEVSKEEAKKKTDMFWKG